MDDLICIKKFGNRTEADIVKSKLDANGITSLVQSDDAGGMYPFMTERIQLFVRKEDKEKAEKLLQT